MGDIEETPTARKGNSARVRNDSHESPAGMGGVTLGLQGMTISSNEIRATATEFQPTIVHSQPAGERSTRQAVVTRPLFTTDPGWSQARHFVKIDGLPATVTQAELVGVAQIVEHKVFTSETCEGKIDVFLCFDDLREAAKFGEACDERSVRWFYLSDSLFSEQARCRHISRFNGQVMFVAEPAAHSTGSTAKPSPSALLKHVTDVAETFGEIIHIEDETDGAYPKYRVEYWKFSAADEAVADCTSHYFENLHIVARSMEYFRTSPELSLSHPVMASTPPQSSGPQIFTSPTGRTAWSYDAGGNLVNEKPERLVPKMGAAASNELMQWNPRAGQWASLPNPDMPSMLGNGNFVAQRSASYPAGRDDRYDSIAADPKDAQDVQIDRIANGTDVRTTVMIRNLPNNWTCDDMKAALDVTSFGKYDFAYLRIDFQRNLNVGYGFVNFTDPDHIIPFCRAYQNQDWLRGAGRTRRLGQISYATVQGYDCLVEKFRNSAILDECPGYRPKLFWTELDRAVDPQVIVGSEKPFPKPNNLTKKQRSSDNAGTQGLFQPNTGKNYDRARGGIRARHSQFDRGTPRQVQEDAAYYSHTAGPAGGYGMMAPIGTPANMYPQQHAGFAPMGQQFYGGFPQANGMGYNPYQAQYPAPYQVPYQAQFPGQQYGYPAGHAGHAGYGAFAGPGQAPPRYNTVNHASQLRTLSNGRLATRPRTNVTVADPSRYDPAPGVPRSIVANTGDFPAANVGNPQYGDAQYYAANNGYAVENGYGGDQTNQFQYPQY